MTEAELDTIETALAVRLPTHYRRFMLDYPHALIDTKLNLGWTQEAPADRKFYNSAAKLVEQNRDVRLPGTPWVGEAGDPWPDQYFVIGDDQCGNYWCVDLGTTDLGVWFYNHDVGEFERQHDSLGGFADQLLAEIAAFNAEKGDRPS
jgi:hypothetical protein